MHDIGEKLVKQDGITMLEVGQDAPLSRISRPVFGRSEPGIDANHNSIDGMLLEKLRQANRRGHFPTANFNSDPRPEFRDEFGNNLMLMASLEIHRVISKREPFERIRNLKEF